MRFENYPTKQEIENLFNHLVLSDTDCLHLSSISASQTDIILVMSIYRSSEDKA